MSEKAIQGFILRQNLTHKNLIIFEIIFISDINMEKPADLIKDAFEQKTWNEIHTTDSWRVFKIISELVEGFEKLARIGPCVSIFGSAQDPL